MKRDAPTRPTNGSIAAALAILAFVVAYMADGYLTLDPASRNVPLLAGTVTIVLALVELARSITVRRRLPAPADASSGAPRGREWQVLASVAGAIAGVYLLGFLVAIPVYLGVAVGLIGGRSWRAAAVTAALTTVAIYVAFELLLSYRLFAGVLLS